MKKEQIEPLEMLLRKIGFDISEIGKFVSGEKYTAIMLKNKDIGICANVDRAINNDLSEYENLPKKGSLEKKYGIENNEKIILYLGRIHKTKGIDLLIGAYADLIKHLDNVRLVIVGPDDGFLSTLKRQIEDLEIGDRILFTGPLHESDKLGAYVDVDVFVTPSFLGFPVTFLEACACGTPIITTRNGDELDWIHDRVGYVVEYNKEQLQDAMSKILSDEGLMRRFGEEGKRLVRNEFGWDKVVKKIEKFYEDCIVCNTPKV